MRILSFCKGLFKGSRQGAVGILGVGVLFNDLYNAGLE